MLQKVKVIKIEFRSLYILLKFKFFFLFFIGGVLREIALAFDEVNNFSTIEKENKNTEVLDLKGLYLKGFRTILKMIEKYVMVRI